MLVTPEPGKQGRSVVADEAEKFGGGGRVSAWSRTVILRAHCTHHENFGGKKGLGLTFTYFNWSWLMKSF